MLQDVYKSESDTNQRNQAIGALMLAYGYIKANWQQASRSLHAPVLDRRQRERPRDDGCHARRSAARTRRPASRSSTARKVPGVLAVTGHRGPATTIPASGSITRDCLQRVVSAAASSQSRPESSALPSCRRRSTTRATAFERSARSPRSPTHWAAILDAQAALDSACH